MRNRVVVVSLFMSLGTATLGCGAPGYGHYAEPAKSALAEKKYGQAASDFAAIPDTLLDRSEQKQRDIDLENTERLYLDEELASAQKLSPTDEALRLKAFKKRFPKHEAKIQARVLVVASVLLTRSDTLAAQGKPIEALRSIADTEAHTGEVPETKARRAKVLASMVRETEQEVAQVSGPRRYYAEKRLQALRTAAGNLSQAPSNSDEIKRALDFGGETVPEVAACEFISDREFSRDSGGLSATTTVTIASCGYDEEATTKSVTLPFQAVRQRTEVKTRDKVVTGTERKAITKTERVCKSWRTKVTSHGENCRTVDTVNTGGGRGYSRQVCTPVQSTDRECESWDTQTETVGYEENPTSTVEKEQYTEVHNETYTDHETITAKVMRRRFSVEGKIVVQGEGIRHEASLSDRDALDDLEYSTPNGNRSTFTASKESVIRVKKSVLMQQVERAKQAWRSKYAASLLRRSGTREERETFAVQAVLIDAALLGDTVGVLGSPFGYDKAVLASVWGGRLAIEPIQEPNVVAFAGPSVSKETRDLVDDERGRRGDIAGTQQWLAGEIFAGVGAVLQRNGESTRAENTGGALAKGNFWLAFVKGAMTRLQPAVRLGLNAEIGAFGGNWLDVAMGAQPGLALGPVFLHALGLAGFNGWLYDDDVPGRTTEVKASAYAGVGPGLVVKLGTIQLNASAVYERRVAGAPEAVRVDFGIWPRSAGFSLYSFLDSRGPINRTFAAPQSILGFGIAYRLDGVQH
jgi:hypothetical protein